MEGVLPDYLRYYLTRDDFGEHLATNVSGVGGSLMRVRPRIVDEYPLVLAPHPEQHRIVAAIEEHLTKLDAAVAALERALVNTHRLRAASLAALIHGTGADVSTIRRTRGGGDIALWPWPQGWSWKRLEDIADVLLGRQRAPQFLTGEHSHPYLRVANVKDDAIDLADLNEMDFDEKH